MSEEVIEPKGIDEIPIFSWNTKTKEFYVLGHKFDGVNSIENFINYIHNLDKENQQLKAENYRLEHNEKVLLQREETAINYIDQVIMYKPCAREIDKELDILIGILRGGNNE